MVGIQTVLCIIPRGFTVGSYHIFILTPWILVGLQNLDMEIVNNVCKRNKNVCLRNIVKKWSDTIWCISE